MKVSAWVALASVIASTVLACSGTVTIVPAEVDGGAGSGGSSPSQAGGGPGGTIDPGLGGATAGGSGGVVDAGSGGATNVGGTGGTNAGGTGGSVMSSCKASAYSDHACGVCMEAHCAAQCAACMSDADCVGWLDCAMQCSDTACQDACTNQYPGGESPALTLYGWDGCMGIECADECTGGHPAPSCDSGLTTNDAECDNCLDDNCCQIVKSCMADAACDDCLMNGTTNACGGNANYAAFDSCWGGICGSACSGLKSCGLVTSDPACETCLETNCCDQGLACANSNDCISVLSCVQNCSLGDTACEDACNAAQPDGAALLSDFFGCLSQSCSMDCQ